MGMPVARRHDPRSQHQARKAAELIQDTETSREAIDAGVPVYIDRSETHIHTKGSGSNSAPVYVPSIGKWCQNNGGSMNCW